MTKKNSSWKNSLTVDVINKNISNVSEWYRTNVDRIGHYKTAMLADYQLPANKGKSKVRPRVIKRLHNYAYSSLSEGLLSDYDIVDVSPRGNSDNTVANAHKLLLNYQLNEEMDFHTVVSKASRYFEDFGSYYIKLTWSHEKRKVLNTKPTELVDLPDNVTPEQLQQLEANGMLSPDGKLIRDRTLTKVVKDHPTISICKHNRIILGTSSDGSNDLQSLSFIAERYYSNISELKNDSRYSNVDKISELLSTDGNTPIEDLPEADFDKVIDEILYKDRQNNPSNSSTADDNTPLVVTEYWTKVREGGTLVTTVTTIVRGVIIRQDKSPLGDSVGYPYARGVNMYNTLDDDDSPYEGVPDTLEVEQEQRVIGAVTRGLIDILGSTANGQKGIAEGFVNPVEERKLELGQHYKFNPALDPNRAMVVHKSPELPNSGLQMLSIMENSMESATGKKLFGQGLGSDSYGSVAAGIKATTDATTQRLVASVRGFNKGFIDIIGMMAELNKEFITNDKVIGLSDGSYTTVRNDSLQSNISIKISTSTPELDDKKANDLMFITQTLGTSVSFRAKQTMLSDIARLKKRPDLAQELLNEPEPQPSPQELELHQLQVELLKAQIANEYAKAEENMADRDLKDAKASTEEAKIGVLNSTKDNQDLDFIHKRSGTREERTRLDKDKDHYNTMEQGAFKAALNMQERTSKNEVITPMKSYNSTRDAVPVIDLPQESLQPSDLNK